MLGVQRAKLLLKKRTHAIAAGFQRRRRLEVGVQEARRARRANVPPLPPRAAAAVLLLVYKLYTDYMRIGRSFCIYSL